MRYLAQTILAAAALALAACTTTTDIPEDASAKELIQRGQEAFEKNRTKAALDYFNAVVDRYGSDGATYIEARYEIAHLYMRKKDYDKAAPVLEEITGLYANYPVGTFPPAYQKLAQIELEKIPEERLAAIHEQQRAQAEQAALEQEALRRQAQEAELQAQLQQAAMETDATIAAEAENAADAIESEAEESESDAEMEEAAAGSGE